MSPTTTKHKTQIPAGLLERLLTKYPAVDFHPPKPTK